MQNFRPFPENNFPNCRFRGFPLKFLALHSLGLENLSPTPQLSLTFSPPKRHIFTESPDLNSVLGFQCQKWALIWPKAPSRCFAAATRKGPMWSRCCKWRTSDWWILSSRTTATKGFGYCCRMGAICSRGCWRRRGTSWWNPGGCRRGRLFSWLSLSATSSRIACKDTQ